MGNTWWTVYTLKGRVFKQQQSQKKKPTTSTRVHKMCSHEKEEHTLLTSTSSELQIKNYLCWTPVVTKIFNTLIHTINDENISYLLLMPYQWW